MSGTLQKEEGAMEDFSEDKERYPANEGRGEVEASDVPRIEQHSDEAQLWHANEGQSFCGSVDGTANHRRDSSQVEVQQYIHMLSTELSDSRELTVDQQLLQTILCQTGEYAYGISAIEVYSFEDPRLVPIDCWFGESTCSLDLQLDETEEGAPLQPEVSIPGVDLIGALWQYSAANHGMKRASHVRNRSWSASFSASFRQKVESPSHAPPQPPSSGGLHWRELKSVIDDPDTIHGPRLEALSQAGFERATGIAFQADGIQGNGMVVYYAKEDVDVELLSAVANETYLRRTTSVIGSTLAMAESRRASIVFQKQSLNDSLISTPDLETAPSLSTPNKSKTFSHSSCEKVWNNAIVWMQKFRGGDSQIPPGMPLAETVWTIIGVLVGLLTVSLLNQLFLSKTEYYLIMGPFGALVTLQYGLTAAPAAQPRNCVLGHAVAIAITLVFTAIPETVLPVWIRQVVAPAVAIGAMVKLGITHPPAGAFSVIFAEGRHGWVFYGITMLASILSLIPATLVNNLSQKRQYPSYWGFFPSWLMAFVEKFAKKHDK